MNRLTQEAKRRQSVVKTANRRGKSYAARQYGVSLSSVKRWCARYDGTWQSLRERSHRPRSHPRQHSEAENELIRAAFFKKFDRYGWDGVYTEAGENGYTRSLSGLTHAAKRLGLAERERKKKVRRACGKYPELLIPGEKVQIDVKEVPYCYLHGDALRNNRRYYQWTAIDECTRFRFIYGFEEHTPENSVKFLQMLVKKFPFKIQTVQTDNGTEFTYRFISDTAECPFDTCLRALGISHRLIPPRTPWHNGKVERSHRNDQRYFYDWERFRSLDDLNIKLKEYLVWSNNKSMRVLSGISPVYKLAHII
jgi:transposase InsO family protein